MPVELDPQRFDSERLHLRQRVGARTGVQELRGALEVVGLAVRGERRRGAGGSRGEGACKRREERLSEFGHGGLRHGKAAQGCGPMRRLTCSLSPCEYSHRTGRHRPHGRGGGGQRAPAAARARAAGGVPGRARARRGRDRGRPDRGGPLERHLLIRRGDTEVVLRRPPRPPLPPSAHDVLREARPARAGGDARACRRAGGGRGPGRHRQPVLCDGAARGRGASRTSRPRSTRRDQRRRISDELIDALVEIHAVDWRAVGLEGFGKPTGYLQRQLRRFGGLWELNKTREIPAVERVGGWLAEHMPESGPATIVHGDFRLGNTVFAPDAPARLAGVLDWEMATIGDRWPTSATCARCGSSAEDPGGGMCELSGVTRREGFPMREELIGRYEQRTGRSMRDLRWYRHWRCGSRWCSWRATTSARSPAPPTTPT